MPPMQALLSRDTDMSKTEETRRVIEGMIDGLNEHRIDDIGEFFAHVLAQLDVDIFDGQGWEKFDSGTEVPPRSTEKGD